MFGRLRHRHGADYAWLGKLRIATAIDRAFILTMDGHWTCARYGDVIGVYEPMIVVNGDDEERRTSRAAEPEPEPSARYHEVCWLQRDA